MRFYHFMSILLLLIMASTSPSFGQSDSKPRLGSEEDPYGEIEKAPELTRPQHQPQAEPEKKKNDKKDSGARFLWMNGNVELCPAGKDPDDPNSWQFAKLNMPLHFNDHVKTGEDSGATIGFPDNSTCKMGPETHILLSPPDEPSKLMILMGNIACNVRKMLEGGTMEIEMNQAVTSIKGTTFELADNRKASVCSVQEGRVNFRCKTTGKSVDLSPGMTATVINDRIIDGDPYSLTSRKPSGQAASNGQVASDQTGNFKRDPKSTPVENGASTPKGNGGYWELVRVTGKKEYSDPPIVSDGWRTKYQISGESLMFYSYIREGLQKQLQFTWAGIQKQLHPGKTIKMTARGKALKRDPRWEGSNNLCIAFRGGFSNLGEVYVGAEAGRTPHPLEQVIRIDPPKGSASRSDPNHFGYIHIQVRNTDADTYTYVYEWQNSQGGTESTISPPTTDTPSDQTPPQPEPKTSISQKAAEEKAQRLVDEAMQFLRQNEPQKAKVKIDEAIRICPNHAEAHYELGRAYEHLHEFSESIPCYEATIRVNPRHFWAHMGLAYAYYKTNQNEKCISEYQKAVAIDPDNVDAKAKLATQFNRTNNFTKALELCQEVVAIQPSNASAHFNLGRALEGLNRRQEAKKSYETAIRIDPNKTVAHINLGCFYADSGEKEKALACWQKALRCNPTAEQTEIIRKYIAALHN